MKVSGRVKRRVFQQTIPGFEIVDGSFLQMFVRSPDAEPTEVLPLSPALRADGEHDPERAQGAARRPWLRLLARYVDSCTSRAPVPAGGSAASCGCRSKRSFAYSCRAWTITGTTDPARKSWALLAFYKYFAGELADIYMKRADALKDAFFKLVTGIHV